MRQFSEGVVSVLGAASPSITLYSTLPQNPSYPAASYSVIHETRQLAVSGETVGVTETGLQVTCVGRTRDEVATLADQVKTVLHGKAQESWGALICRLCVLDSVSDLLERDGDKLIHGVVLRFTVYTNSD